MGHKPTILWLGFTRQRYLAQDGFAYSKVGDKIVLNPISNGQRVKSSHIDVWSFNVPVLYKQRFARNLHFCIGGIMNLNSYASAQTEINEGKAKRKIKLKGLQQNLFTADAYFSLGIRCGQRVRHMVADECIVNPVNQGSSGGLQWSKSFEIGWLSCFGVKYGNRRCAVSLGLGFDWRNYKITTTDKCLVANGRKGIEWGSYPLGCKGQNSRLKVFSLQLPLLYSWVVPKTNLVFKCGPVFNFNTYSSLKTAYEDADGNKIEDFTKAISPRRFTLDFFGSLSYKHTLGIYVRHSPMKVMDASTTINFQPLSVGVTLGI